MKLKPDTYAKNPELSQTEQAQDLTRPYLTSLNQLPNFAEETTYFTKSMKNKF